MSSEWPLLYQGQRQRGRGKWTLGLFELAFKLGGKNYLPNGWRRWSPRRARVPGVCRREAAEKRQQSCDGELDGRTPNEGILKI